MRLEQEQKKKDEQEAKMLLRPKDYTSEEVEEYNKKYEEICGLVGEIVARHLNDEELGDPANDGEEGQSNEKKDTEQDGGEPNDTKPEDNDQNTNQ